jgi:type IV secretory pathway VirB4 component
VTEIRRNIAGAHAEIYSYQNKLARQQADITILPPALKDKADTAEELLNFIQEQDQQIANFSGYISVYASSLAELESNVALVKSEAATWTIDVEDMYLRQEEALVCALPLADTSLLKAQRTLTTAEGAIMMPFSSQIINHAPEKSYLLGQDTQSKRPIFINPSRLKSPHMWLMGITGAGKGMCVKSIIAYSCLSNPRTDNTSLAKLPQWFIMDFHGEYTDIVSAFGGKTIDVSPVSKTCFNPLDITNEQGQLTRKALTQNSDYFLAQMQDVMGRELEQSEKSMIDRCILKIYEPYIKTNSQNRPTLQELFVCLKEQQSEVAVRIVEAFELFVTGSMSVFNGQTNAIEDDYLTSYDCSELGHTLQTFAILTLMKRVECATYKNYQAGRPTYFLMEETQKIFDNDAAVRVLDDYFSELRKYNLHIICVTQLPKRVLEHQRAQYLFDNSSLMVFLANSPDNAQKITSLFNLSDSQKDCMSLSAPPGSGLVIADGIKLSMRNDIPKTSALYRLFNTDPEKKSGIEILKADEQASAIAEKKKRDDVLEALYEERTKRIAAEENAAQLKDLVEQYKNRIELLTTGARFDPRTGERVWDKT